MKQSKLAICRTRMLLISIALSLSVSIAAFDFEAIVASALDNHAQLSPSLRILSEGLAAAVAAESPVTRATEEGPAAVRHQVAAPESLKHLAEELVKIETIIVTGCRLGEQQLCDPKVYIQAVEQYTAKKVAFFERVAEHDVIFNGTDYLDAVKKRMTQKMCDKKSPKENAGARHK